MFPEVSSRIVFVTLVMIACATIVCAQDPEPTPTATPQPTPLTAPPPMRSIPPLERSQLEVNNDPKQRIRKTIELSALHLTAAEKHTSQSNFEAASREVGTYHALIQNALTFLATLKRDSNKTRDTYKRLELALRSDAPRLTSMRRITPIEFAVWIKQTEDFAREGRTEALNSFYGHTVVRDPEKTSDKPKLPPKGQQP